MGTDVHLLAVNGPEGCLAAGAALVADLEARWSRFVPDSELSRLNAAPGLPVVVSEPTFDVISLAVEAWWETAGRYDPTVLPALVAAGYDRPYRQMDHEITEGLVPPGRGGGAPAPGCAEIELMADIPAVVLPEGVALDLGGIGKGAAADRVVAAVIGAGAAGACANMGGDVFADGVGPLGGAWTIGVDGADGEQRAVLSLASGGVATSSPARRRWVDPGGAEAHHLIDPVTGRPAPEGPASVTVVAGTAARAEVLAKAVWLAPDDAAEVLDASGATCLIVDRSGAERTVGPWEELLA
jgi:thiamine biosynthesis lipoprotein